MEALAKITSKGQVTIPKSVRDALGLREGDHVVFRVEGSQASIGRTRDLLDLAGAVPVPAHRRGSSWDDIIDAAHRARARTLP